MYLCSISVFSIIPWIFCLSVLTLNSKSTTFTAQFINSLKKNRKIYSYYITFSKDKFDNFPNFLSKGTTEIVWHISKGIMSRKNISNPIFLPSTPNSYHQLCTYEMTHLIAQGEIEMYISTSFSYQYSRQMWRRYAIRNCRSSM